MAVCGLLAALTILPINNYKFKSVDARKMFSVIIYECIKIVIVSEETKYILREFVTK